MKKIKVYEIKEIELEIDDIKLKELLKKEIKEKLMDNCGIDPRELLTKVFTIPKNCVYPQQIDFTGKSLYEDEDW